MQAANANAVIAGALAVVAVSFALPVILVQLTRLLAFLTIVVGLGVLTNPSDRSFAQWLGAQDNVRFRPNATLKQWVSGIFNTMLAMLKNEELTWRVHNLLVCTVVYVPCIKRFAIGFAGNWWWADEHPILNDFCESEMIESLSRGGEVSGLHRHLAAHRASAKSGGVDASHKQQERPVSASDLRTRAIQLKLKKKWRSAAQVFLQAADASSSTSTRSSFQLEAALCFLEASEKLSYRAEYFALARSSSQQLARANEYDEAARALFALAVAIKRKFPSECRSVDYEIRIAQLFIDAMRLFERTGRNGSSVVDCGTRAALTYADAELWSRAEEMFERVVRLSLKQSDTLSAKTALVHAALCKIADGDVAGSQHFLNKYSDQIRNATKLDAEELLRDVYNAYETWSLDALDAAMRKFQSRRGDQLWQSKCIASLRDRMRVVNLR